MMLPDKHPARQITRRQAQEDANKILRSFILFSFAYNAPIQTATDQERAKYFDQAQLRLQALIVLAGAGVLPNTILPAKDPEAPTNGEASTGDMSH